MFHDYIVKGHSSQDYIYFEVIIQLTSRMIHDTELFINNIIIQSDNASGFSSTNLIPCKYNINNFNKESDLPEIY